MVTLGYSIPNTINNNCSEMDFSKQYKLGTETPLEVSQFIEFLNEVLKRIKARIIGEVTAMKIDTNGHVWFSLRDKKNGNTIGCVIWKYNYKMCGVELKEGLEVIVSGSSDIYPARGSFNFKVDTVELVGEGALKKAYDELKKKLTEEGIFDLSSKRTVPDYPQKVGVITSLRSGTVIHDFTSNLGKFGFKIRAMDSRVEGQEAVKSLLSCLESFRGRDIEVLVIIRGGGSLESLMAFDNEMLVRAIADFPVPVIAGIGHHKDITLTSLAASVSESTPTAAAQLLNRSWERALHKIESGQNIIIREFQSLIQSSKENLNSELNLITQVFVPLFKEYERAEKRITREIFKLEYSISSAKKVILENNSFVIKAFISRLVRTKENLFVQWKLSSEDGFIPLKDRFLKGLLGLEKIIFQNNPERQLRLGYSITRAQGKIVKDIISLNEGDLLETKIFNGTIGSEIKKITPNK